MQTFPTRLSEVTRSRRLEQFASVMATKALGLSNLIPSTTKAAVGANTTADDASLTDPVQAFARVVAEQSAFGRLVPLALPASPPYRVTTITADPAPAWIGEGNPIPVGRTTFRAVTMAAHQIATIFAASRELFQSEDSRIRAMLTRRAARQLARAVDTMLLSTVAATSGSPAGLLASAPSLGGGSPADVGRDLSELFAFVSDGRATTPVVILSPRTALYLATLNEDLFRDVGVNGGSIGGIPVIPSAAAGNKIALLDCDALVMFDGGVEIARSDVASVEMSDAPGQSAATGTGAQLVSFFQTGTAGVKLLQTCDYQLLADDGIAFVELADIGGSPA
jgi:HK97 family phage major capsid protein